MHHPTDRIAHTTAFVTPVVEHWLEREIAQWVVFYLFTMRFHKSAVPTADGWRTRTMGVGEGGGGVKMCVYVKFCSVLFYRCFCNQQDPPVLLSWRYCSWCTPTIQRASAVNILLYGAIVCICTSKWNQKLTD